MYYIDILNVIKTILQIFVQMYMFLHENKYFTIPTSKVSNIAKNAHMLTTYVDNFAVSIKV